jgi:hypothetical protein
MSLRLNSSPFYPIEIAMKFLLISLLISGAVLSAQTERFISGKVESHKDCSKKAMVWLSYDKDNYKERLLLMHTLVPIGGTFQFNVKPGEYQVRASDEAGCEFFKRLSVKGSDPYLAVKLEKK